MESEPSWLKEGAFAYFGLAGGGAADIEWRHAAPPILVSQIETPKAKAPRTVSNPLTRPNLASNRTWLPYLSYLTPFAHRCVKDSKF